MKQPKTFTKEAERKIKKILGIREDQAMLVLGERTEKGETMKGGILSGNPITLGDMLCHAMEVLDGAVGVDINEGTIEMKKIPNGKSKKSRKTKKK